VYNSRTALALDSSIIATSLDDKHFGISIQAWGATTTSSMLGMLTLFDLRRYCYRMSPALSVSKYGTT